LTAENLSANTARAEASADSVNDPTIKRAYLDLASDEDVERLGRNRATLSDVGRF